ncbi:8-amino-7-oxononanoate synthase [Limimonas halophila]|uniref:8-amino-7-oxononanoate synthase n=1 Tax=Limimonas halophila TaxID=1082479 RepID=A0A1G7M8Q7_9PROT|nr:8-amino-7-oxononanoate synthase [Limimonas halophila]SDF58107.1 8-amino-7-oxononanoate synthase [Limimonas halophila]
MSASDSANRTWVDQALRERAEQGLLRSLTTRPAAEGDAGINFAGNDYLDLARDSVVCDAAAEAARAWGAGATASRLVTGTLPVHEALEAELAAVMGGESALVFGSGYLANLGVLSALAGRGTPVFCDRLNHASLLDGVRLAGARWQRYRHNDPEHLDALLGKNPGCESAPALVVTDSVFSMDGDVAPLAEIAAVARRHGALLIVDEAHALGVLGPGGAGACAAAGVRADVLTGGFGKAVGGYGGFAVCDARLRAYLINHARAFIYTTGLPPASAAAAQTALRRIREDGGRMGARLLAVARGLAARLTARGFRVPAAQSPILPVHIGDNEQARAMADALSERGVICGAMRPPTVPPGTARLRVSVTLAHDDAGLLDRAADAFAEAADVCGVARER